MLATKEYERERAVEYARRWARGRNPLFYNFTGVGGDCTNFVSQCVLAGSCVMNFTPDFGWYYRTPDDRAPAFTGVEFFWDFMTGAPDFATRNGGIGPFGRAAEMGEVEPGDVVQLADRTGDFYHTLLVSEIRNGEILVTAHSNDVYNRPLSSYDAPGMRFLHLEGVRFEIGENACFQNLIEGRALPQD
ncbi:MAG: amidase domain-containing protein [Clostridia bacterium]|nr:amidase domain-containing protein [Clostridia bacterium]